MDTQPLDPMPVRAIQLRGGGHAAMAIGQRRPPLVLAPIVRAGATPRLRQRWRTHRTPHTAHRTPRAQGLDLYGRPTDAIWFYLARRTRKRLIVAFLLNCVFQYLNQATRIIFPDYESSNSWPGVLWVNIFFGLSFAMGIGAGIGQLLSESRLRSRLPQYFGPGPIQLAREASRLYKQGNSVRSIGSKLRSTIADFHARRELLIAEVASRFSNERSSDRRMSAGVAQGEGSGERDSAEGGLDDESVRRPPVRAATTPSIAWRRALHNSIVGALGEEQQQSALLDKKGSARGVLGKRVLVSPSLGPPLGPARVAASPPAKRNGPSDAATCASELRAASLGGRVSYAPAAERAPATAPVRRPSNVPAGAQPIPDSPHDDRTDGVPREMSRGSSQGSSPPRHRAASLESRMAILASTVAGGMCTAADRTLEVAGMMGVLPSARARCPTMGAAHMQQQRRGGAAASADEHAGVAAGAGAAYAAAAQESPPLSARSGRTETTNAPTEPSTSSPAAAAPRSASPSGVSTPATASPPATAPASPDAPPTSI